jgi:hypothetical protein
MSRPPTSSGYDAVTTAPVEGWATSIANSTMAISTCSSFQSGERFEAMDDDDVNKRFGEDWGWCGRARFECYEEDDLMTVIGASSRVYLSMSSLRSLFYQAVTSSPISSLSKQPTSLSSRLTPQTGKNSITNSH